MRDNKGRFLPGPDGARHRFTRAQCKRGYRAARKKLFASFDPVDGPAWLLFRVKGWYLRKS
jgi:hypothetical protein